VQTDEIDLVTVQDYIILNTKISARYITPPFSGIKQTRLPPFFSPCLQDTTMNTSTIKNSSAPSKKSFATENIAPDGDLLVRITSQGKPALSISCRVRRDTLIENSTFFKRLLTGNFGEAKQSVVHITEDDAESLSIWFRVLHDKVLEKDPSYKVNTKTIWYLIICCDKRQFSLRKLEGWFSEWYKEHLFPAKSLEDPHAQTLLYPCLMLNHAKGFQLASKHLVYNWVNHIEEVNPTGIHQFHLPQRVIREYYILPELVLADILKTDICRAIERC